MCKLKKKDGPTNRPFLYIKLPNPREGFREFRKIPLGTFIFGGESDKQGPRYWQTKTKII